MITIHGYTDINYILTWFFFLSLITGVGVILVAISGIAWRLTAGQEASSCGAVFGLGRSLDDAAEANRRFVPRLPPSYGRPHHPYAGKIDRDLQEKLSFPILQKYRNHCNFFSFDNKSTFVSQRWCIRNSNTELRRHLIKRQCKNTDWDYCCWTDRQTCHRLRLHHHRRTGRNQEHW